MFYSVANPAQLDIEKLELAATHQLNLYGNGTIIADTHLQKQTAKTAKTKKQTY